MTRLYLAAGVAALAIAVPATAGPGGRGGGQRVERGQQAQRVQAVPRMQRVERQAARPQRIERQAPHMQRMAMQAQRLERVRPNRAERAQARPDRVERLQAQRVERARRVDRGPRVQERMADRRQMQVNRQQLQANRAERVADRIAARQGTQANRALAVQNRVAARQQLQANRVAAAQSRFALRSALATERLDTARALAPLPLALTAARTRVIPVGQAVQYVGQPLSALSGLGLMAMPSALSYLYPTTPDYYYQYGNGYAYQVDRTSSLIAALLPLIAGGYMPGQYLPASYMSSYVPNYYGLNSFYPATYGAGYGSGYDNLCNRYANGVVYQVDCYTGLVENVVPLYASGYGVGQMIPSSYSYYNVPYQYRSIYPASASSGYWYAPGAIYQYDPSSSLITSVAALLSPGMTIGQPLPVGYGAYNVPYAYRAQYVDSADAWYRYNNGYIYRVDPATQVVSAIVASILT